MVWLIILMVSTNAAPGFFVPSGHPACAAATPPPRRASSASFGTPPDSMTAPPKPVSSQEGFFWKTKTLEEMSSVEWESLCDGCARCCLDKLEDYDTGKIYFTPVSGKLLDAGT